MRPLLTTAVLLAPLLASCEGGLGGDPSQKDYVASAKSAVEEGRLRRARLRAEAADRPDEPDEPDEPVEPDVPEDPADDPATGTDSGGGESAGGSTEAPAEDPPKSTGSSGGSSRGGGRGGRGGGKGSDVGVELTVTDPGSGDGVAVLTGRAVYAGTPPPRQPIAAALSKPECCEHGDPMTEDVVVTDGGLRDVLVAIRKVPSGVEIPPPSDEPLVLDQVGCTYVPHVAAIQAGQKILARNSDDTGHNVRVSASKNTGPNATMQAGAPDFEIDLPKPEQVRFVCDIHPWMGADVHILEHPWFAVSAADGSFTIPDLPAGEYEFEAEHPRLGKARTESVRVEGGGKIELILTFEGK